MLGGIIAADALVLKHQDINICNTAWMAIAQPKIDKKKKNMLHATLKYIGSKLIW